MTAKENSRSQQFVLFFLCHSLAPVGLEKELQIIFPFHSFMIVIINGFHLLMLSRKFFHYQMADLAL